MHCPLTRREFEVLELGQRGLTYAQTAKELFVVLSTVRTHWHNIYVKLGVGSRGEALVTAVRYGWLGAHPDASGLPILVFSERPRSLEVTDGQRLYLRAFDEMLDRRTEESVEAFEVVADAMRWEAAANSRRVPPSRPCADVDAFFLRVARAIGGWKPVRNQSAPFGDRDLVTDVPVGV